MLRDGSHEFGLVREKFGSLAEERFGNGEEKEVQTGGLSW